MLRPVSALLLILCLAAPAVAQTSAPGHPATVSVTGHGEASAQPDIATIRIGVEIQADAPGAALEQNSAAVERVIEEIRAAGVQPKNIQTANFSVYPVYEHPRPEQTMEAPGIVGFRVSNEVVARIRDLDKIGSVLASVVDAGANRINGLNFEIEDETALRDEARRAAMDDARHAAELYAEAAGVTLGRVLSVSDTAQGPMPVARPMMRMEAADAGAVPIERGENTLSTSVDVVWEILPGE